MRCNREFLVLLCVGCTTVLAGLFGGTSEVSKAIDACKKDSKKCRYHCLSSKLKYINAAGDFIPEKAPFYDLATKFDIYGKCANSATASDKCDRVNDQFKCYGDELTKVLNEKSVECAKETNTPDAKPGTDNMLDSAQKPEHACYCRCVLNKLGVLDGNDNAMLSELLKNINILKPADVDGFVKACAKQNNQADVCAKVMKRATCAVYKAIFKIGPSQLMKMKTFAD